MSPAENVSNIITAENDTVPLSNPLYEFNICESDLVLTFVFLKWVN